MPDLRKMIELEGDQKVDLDKVDFLSAMRALKFNMATAPGGVEWAQVYVTPKGRPAVLYKTGTEIKTKGARDGDFVIQFFDNEKFVRLKNGEFIREATANSFYAVDVYRLERVDGDKQEAENARLFINRAFYSSNEYVVLERQRAVPFFPPLSARRN